MNTRLLRMARRSEVFPRSLRLFVGLGQMQPVTISRSRGQPFLHVEAVAMRYGVERPCWLRLNLIHDRCAARYALAAMEAHKRDGTRSAASIAWDRITREEFPPEPFGDPNDHSFRA